MITNLIRKPLARAHEMCTFPDSFKANNVGNLNGLSSTGFGNRKMQLPIALLSLLLLAMMLIFLLLFLLIFKTLLMPILGRLLNI